jgi:hypothetical protein
MEMERIKNYNQKLLAALGTVVAIVAIVGLVALTYFVIAEIGRDFRFNNKKTGILSDEKIEKLIKENKRQQVISYNFPQLVDTLNSIYIIPVSHKTLNEPEYIDEGLLDLLDIHESMSNPDDRYSKRFYGSFNNLLVYDLKVNRTTKLFDERINFGEIRTEYFDDDILVLFEAADKDTYKDGVINLVDYKSLYIYSLGNDNLQKITFPNSDISHYNFIEGSKDLLIQFGIDKNGNGKYEEYQEPGVMKKYDYHIGELQEIIDEEISNELQKILEGTEKL